MIVHSFPPLVSPQAKVLILGSMPGLASLQAGQYYAHPRNLFWPIMMELLAGNSAWDYPQRVDLLSVKGIAVWDVLKSCQRQGSLDAAIDKSTVITNDFKDFFVLYPNIQQVLFNGKTAQQLFTSKVLPNLGGFTLTCQCLPSTSPAHAALSFPQKFQVWHNALADSGYC